MQLIISPADYAVMVNDPQVFRQQLGQFSETNPELFPPDIKHGYQLHGFSRDSVKMPEIKRRRLKLKAVEQARNSRIYTVVPRCVLSHIADTTTEVEKALFLQRCGVLFEALLCIWTERYILATRGLKFVSNFNRPSTNLTVLCIMTIGCKTCGWLPLWAVAIHPTQAVRTRIF